MKEILDIAVWIGIAFVLFIFLRGMNETQVQKHKDKLDEIDKRNKEKEEENKKND
ncbi:MAG: hypothetical protein U9R37_01095 [Campylobacterota bacterium]|nr:hypothetical protein [Campylobacterota bacterium]